jgi:FkbM family methyltransferase
MEHPVLTLSEDLVEFAHNSLQVRLRTFGEHDHISRLLRERRTFYEIDVLNRIAQFDFGDGIAVDAGAFIGNHTVFFAKVLGLRTLAVEPNPAAFEILLRNAALNGIEERVEPVAAALWSTPGGGSIAGEDPGNRGKARFRLGEGPLEATTVDRLASDRPVALLKIDVEGAEIEVLKGSLETIRRCRPLVVVECMEIAERRAVDALLQPLGYLRIGSAGATPTYFYAIPEAALSVALNGEFNAAPALYRLNPAAFLAAADCRQRRAEEIRLGEVRAALARSDEHRRLLADEVERLRARVDALRVERVSESVQRQMLERRLEHQNYRRGLVEKKLEALYGVQDRALSTRLRRLASGATRGWIRQPPSAKGYASFLKRQSNKKWQELQGGSPDAAGSALVAVDPLERRAETVTVFLATFPEREANLPRVVEALRPQCDLLLVYLNEYERVPDCLQVGKVRTVLGREAAGDLKDNGKFFSVSEAPEGFHVFADDDILYPPDYVERIVAGIRQFGYRTIVGFHGTIYEPPLRSYIKDRTVLPFFAACRTTFVDQLGTGTVGYHSSAFTPDFAAFESTGIADLWFALNAAAKGVPMVALERPKGWLRNMEEVGESLFRRASRDDSRESALLRNRLVPALEQRPRRPLLNFLRSVHLPSYLEHAGLDLRASLGGAFGPGEARSDVHFALIVTGWNCRPYAGPCIDSIARQVPGHYSLDIYLYDDGSDDGTWEELAFWAERLNLRTFRGEANTGPAFSRDFLLRQVSDPDTICVLVDLDDRLLPTALVELERIYRNNPDCWMTYGNWINQKGVVNTEGFYTDDEIDRRAYRFSDTFRFTHLRSFRRFLYDKVDPAHLKGPDGTWLRHCSDVGLMLPIADQCSSGNVVALKEPVYLYNQYLPMGTQKRFRNEKKAMFRYLQGRTSLFLFDD